VRRRRPRQETRRPSGARTKSRRAPPLPPNFLMLRPPVRPSVRPPARQSPARQTRTSCSCSYCRLRSSLREESCPPSIRLVLARRLHWLQFQAQAERPARTSKSPNEMRAKQSIGDLLADWEGRSAVGGACSPLLSLESPLVFGPERSDQWMFTPPKAPAWR